MALLPVAGTAVKVHNSDDDDPVQLIDIKDTIWECRNPQATDWWLEVSPAPKVLANGVQCLADSRAETPSKPRHSASVVADCIKEFAFSFIFKNGIFSF